MMRGFGVPITQRRPLAPGPCDDVLQANVSLRCFRAGDRVFAGRPPSSRRLSTPALAHAVICHHRRHPHARLGRVCEAATCAALRHSVRSFGARSAPGVIHPDGATVSRVRRQSMCAVRASLPARHACALLRRARVTLVVRGPSTSSRARVRGERSILASVGARGGDTPISRPPSQAARLLALFEAATPTLRRVVSGSALIGNLEAQPAEQELPIQQAESKPVVPCTAGSHGASHGPRAGMGHARADSIAARARHTVGRERRQEHSARSWRPAATESSRDIPLVAGGAHHE
jgi:hypothetical protein